MKKSILAVSLSLLFVAGCGSTPTKKASSLLPQGIKFSNPLVTLHLTQKINVEGYPEEIQLQKLLQDEIAHSLSESGRLAAGSESAWTVKVDIEYQRHFAGEDTPIPSKSVAPPMCNYKLHILESNVERYAANYNQVTVNRGLGSNLLTVATMGLGKTPKDEEHDIQTLARGIVEDIKSLK